MNKPSSLLYLAAFGLALIASLAVTPVARRFAIRIGLSDEPTTRKAHPEPIALMGGIAIYGAAAVAAFLAVPGSSETMKGIFLGGLVILFVGLQDDLAGMDPWVKLLGQVTSALVLVGFGLRSQLSGIPLLDTAITVVWVVVVVNAINLSDNMDGLAGGLTAAACISYFAIAVVWGQYLVATLAALLAGGVIGFLVYNFPPAKIFMGDAGSHFLGFLLAVMGLNLKFPTKPHVVAVFIPPMVLAVPLVDMAMVTISRRRRGVPASRGGTDHTSHRLVVLGLTRRQAVLTLWATGLLCGGAALAVSKLPTPAALVLAGLFGIACIAALVWLERLGTPEGLVYEKLDDRGANPHDEPDREAKSAPE